MKYGALGVAVPVLVQYLLGFLLSRPSAFPALSSQGCAVFSPLAVTLPPRSCLLLPSFAMIAKPLCKDR